MNEWMNEIEVSSRIKDSIVEKFQEKEKKKSRKKFVPVSLLYPEVHELYIFSAFTYFFLFLLLSILFHFPLIFFSFHSLT